MISLWHTLVPMHKAGAHHPRHVTIPLTFTICSSPCCWRFFSANSFMTATYQPTGWGHIRGAYVNCLFEQIVVCSAVCLSANCLLRCPLSWAWSPSPPSPVLITYTLQCNERVLVTDNCWCCFISCIFISQNILEYTDLFRIMLTTNQVSYFVNIPHCRIK